jgi:hypothetical protein
VAKKVFPLSIDLKERRILEALSIRDGVSMAESMRRLIRSASLDVLPPPVAIDWQQTSNTAR